MPPGLFCMKKTSLLRAVIARLLPDWDLINGKCNSVPVRNSPHPSESYSVNALRLSNYVPEFEEWALNGPDAEIAKTASLRNTYAEFQIKRFPTLKAKLARGAAWSNWQLH